MSNRYNRLLESSKTPQEIVSIVERLNSENRGGFSRAIFNDYVEDNNAGFGWLGHQDRSVDKDKELETLLRKTYKYSNDQISTFIVSTIGRHYGDTLDKPELMDKAIKKFKSTGK